MVLRPAVARRPAVSSGEIVLGVLSLLVIAGGIGFGVMMFTRQRKPPAAARATTVAVEKGAARERPPPDWVSEENEGTERAVAETKPTPDPEEREAAMRHLEEALAKIRGGLFDVAKDAAGKAAKADPTLKKQAKAMWHVSEYAKRYQPLSEQALGSLDGSSEVNLGPGKEKCLFVGRDGDTITFRVDGKNERFTIPQLSGLPGVRFRITSRFLDNAREPGNDLILGAVQYVNGLDPDGVPLRKGVNPIPDRWVKATKSPQATTRQHAESMLELSRLELHD